MERNALLTWAHGLIEAVRRAARNLGGGMYQVEVFFTFREKADAVAFGDSMLEHENSATYVVRDTREPVMTLTGAEVGALQDLVINHDFGAEHPASAREVLRAKVQDSF